ncbi:MAG: SUMF1/EgtB/PvdO family nonheme iron enzyme [Pseudomonadota bacterium]
MDDTANNVIDARLSDALGTYFNGVQLRASVGECALLDGVRKQNGAPVSIYTASFSVSKDDAAVAEIGKRFAIYEKLGHPRLQAVERLLNSRAFKKMPALAVLACPEEVFNEAFDTQTIEARLGVFDQVLDALAALHGVGLIHGNLSPATVRRETAGGLLRLTDLTFSGERATTVTGQPVAYQSRHVVNAAQPRPEDDVYAAGMLGYRIILGPDGPSTTLAGESADNEMLVAAILGDERPAPTADELFPGGHPKAEQISRLLARMIGRLDNAAPYSSAEAARKAFQTVLSGQSAPDIETVQVGSVPYSPPPSTGALRSAGVSGATAIMLFTGFLASAGGASYFALASKSLRAELGDTQSNALAQARRFETVEKTRAVLRDADRAIAIAGERGAATASETSAAALSAAKASLSEADDGVLQDAGPAKNAAEAALARAGEAIEETQRFRVEAESANEAYSAAWDLAAQATGGRQSDLGTILAFAEAAEADFAQRKFDGARAAWAEGTSELLGLVERLRTEADTAKSTYLSAGEAPSPAADILARSYVARADSAFEIGRFGDAIRLYHGALATLSAAPIEAPRAGPNTRSIRIGDDNIALEQAIELCFDAAPIAREACPDSRDPGEAARDAEIGPFELDQAEVSVGEFRAFIEDTGYKTEAEAGSRVVAVTSSGEARLIDGAYSWAQPQGTAGPAPSADMPVTNISLNDARAYCNWAEKRLPSEAEWEAAARGDGTAVFPWGSWEPSEPVWRGAPGAGRRLPSAVNSAGGASPSGLQGLSGNAREWVEADGGAVLKGGSWNSANPADLRISARLSVPNNAPGVDFGFRCARDLETWP